MRKIQTRYFAVALSMILTFGLCACKEGKEVPTPPEGYTKERGENMFWEKEDELFDGYVLQNTDIKIYNYCPSIMEEDENTRHVYYCSNRYSTGAIKEFEWSGVSPKQQGKYTDYEDELGDNTITDYVAYRKAVRINGEWWWSPKQYVLGPTPGSRTEWEQTCDPNVIKGEFSYNGEQYSYLMAYLACATRDNTYNHVCVAVANAPEGPWLKCDDINPLIEYTSDDVPELVKNNTYLWGYGQASMINIGKGGEILMFYSSICPAQNETTGAWGHATNTTIARYDLSNLNDAKQTEIFRGIPSAGLTYANGNSIESFTNADYAYDPETNRIYVVGDRGFVGYVEDRSMRETPLLGDVFFDYKGKWNEENISWTTIANFTAEYPRAYTSIHNNCIIRDEYGMISNSQRLEFAITGGMTEGDYKQVFPTSTMNIWTFRILRKTLEI